LTEPLPSREDRPRLANFAGFARDSRVRYDSDRMSAEEAQSRLMLAYEELSVAEEALRAQAEAITEAERQVEIERHRYRTLFEFAPDPYLVTDAEGIIEQANGAAAEFLGVPGALLVGKPLVNFVDLRTRSEFRAHVRGLGSNIRDRMLVDLTVRDGRAVSVEATATAIPTHGE
jgi:PAS domain S-box-containing protein